MINMILATGLNGELGCTSSPDGLPWKKNPEDLAHFQKMTKGNVVVMGGNTFRQLQEIGFENGLPERDNIVITTKNGLYTELPEGSVEFASMSWTEWVLGSMGDYKDEIFIIGGKSIYDQLHQYCDKVYLTRINDTFPDADVIMDLSWLAEFKLVDKETLNDYSWVEIYERK